MLRRSTPTASHVPFTSADTITSTNVQDAIVEALTDAKQYSDSVAAGLDPKAAVDVATFAPLPANTRVGHVLTADADGALPNIDTSYAPVVGHRVLVKNEVLGANNGIYIIDSVGSPSTRWSMTRSWDADNTPLTGEVTSGMYTTATFGAHAGQGWFLQTPDPITINVTALNFQPFAVFNLDSAHVLNTPAGNILATNTQAAINELDTEKAALTGATFTGTISATNLTGTNTGDQVASGVPFTSADTIASTNAQDAIVEALTDARAYTDSQPSKISVKAATVYPLPTNTRTGDVLTASAVGALPAIDGVPLSVNDRVLVKNEVVGANNGIYVVTDAGSGGTPWVLTRAFDAVNGRLVAGSHCFVESGNSFTTSSKRDVVLEIVATSTSPTLEWGGVLVGDWITNFNAGTWTTIVSHQVTTNGSFAGSGGYAPTIGDRYLVWRTPSATTPVPVRQYSHAYVSITTSPTHAMWAALQVGDLIVGCQNGAYQQLKSTVVTVPATLPLTPVYGDRYLVLRVNVPGTTPTARICSADIYNMFSDINGEQWSTVLPGDFLTCMGPGTRQNTYSVRVNEYGVCPGVPSNPAIGDRFFVWHLNDQVKNAVHTWQLTTPGPITVNATSLSFSQLKYGP